MNFHSPKIEEHMRFICPECGVDLPTQIIWRKHLNTSHDYNKKTVDVFNFKEINSRYHECNECHKWVANGNQSITTLQYHRISHLPYNLTFKCKHCVKAFARKRALCDHLINDHKDLIKDTNMNFSTGSTTTNNYQQQQHSDATKKQLDSFGAEHNSNRTTTEDSYRNKKGDPGDLIQKALLDSLIDLENETLSDVNMNQHDVNDFALNQSLNELEAILKGDFEGSSLSTQFTATDNYHNQYAGTQYAEAGVLDADNEALEEICADIFEEVEEPVVEQSVDNQRKDIASTSRSVANKERNSLPRCEEKIISIEIDTINESERRDMYSSPKRKRLKLETPISTNGEIDERIKRMFETFIVYLCPECGREYKTQAEWRNHVFKVHDLNNTLYAKYQSLRSGSAFRCLECRQVLKTAKMQELMRHRFTHMPFQSYLKCTFCSKTKSSKPKIMQHMQMFHGGKLAAPSTTTTTTTTTSSTSNKKLSHYVCSYCEKAFQARDRFQAHRQNCGARHKLGGRVKEANESSITSNLNLIAHLKKMRARMRTLISTDDAKVTHQSISQHNKANYRKY